MFEIFQQSWMVQNWMQVTLYKLHHWNFYLFHQFWFITNIYNFVAPTSSPLISSNAKRSLNRSVDTPRIIKQIKESKTPSNPRDSFSPKFQSTIFKGSSDDNDEDDSDVIEVSSEDEVVTKHTTQSCANKTVRQTTLDAHVKPSGLFVAPHVPAEIKEEAITPEKIEVSLISYINMNEFSFIVFFEGRLYSLMLFWDIMLVMICINYTKVNS